MKPGLLIQRLGAKSQQLHDKEEVSLHWPNLLSGSSGGWFSPAALSHSSLLDTLECLPNVTAEEPVRHPHGSNITDSGVLSTRSLIPSTTKWEADVTNCNQLGQPREGSRSVVMLGSC